jgi:hypothetical protein
MFIQKFLFIGYCYSIKVSMSSPMDTFVLFMSSENKYWKEEIKLFNSIKFILNDFLIPFRFHLGVFPESVV